MVKLRAKKIIEVNANTVASSYSNWCKNQSGCLYKDKKRKYHGWLNLNNLKDGNKVAQCGWDNGNCNHSTHYGIGGYHNICPIAGINGDYVWPAKIQLSDFEFEKNTIIDAKKNIENISKGVYTLNTYSVEEYVDPMCFFPSPQYYMNETINSGVALFESQAVLKLKKS